MRIEGVLFFGYIHTGGECEFGEKNRELYFSVYTPNSEYSGEELYHFCDSEELFGICPMDVAHVKG